jgi:hypothetical protein
MRRKKLKLEDYEVVCSKCSGKGYLKKVGKVIPTCSKCFGSGKLDWIENIVGKRRPRRGLQVSWPVSDAEDFKSMFGARWDSEIISKMSEELAKEIDREIIKELLKIGEKKSGKDSSI